MDYYSILGVQRNASSEEIKKAYKKKAMQHHPDRGGDANTFQKIQEAYETLSDPAKKQQYDRPQRQYNSSQFRGQNPFEGPDMFGNMFNDMRYARNRQHANITIAAKLTLEEVLTGKNLIASYALNNGKKETVNINVPAGANNDQHIRFTGLGNEVAPGVRGDLHVKIQIKDHHTWLRDKDNLYAEHSVNAIDMITGCVTIVHTLDNRSVQLKIPAGTQANTKFRIPGYGLPNVNSRKKGDAFVVITPHIPKVTDENILRKLKKLRNNIDK